MNVLWIRVVSQIGIYVVFLLYALWAMRRGPHRWIPLGGAVLYAIVFEHANMARYAHTPGGYHYHPASWCMILGDVPLYIPLAWGFILSTSMRITEHLGIHPGARPFCDALLALLIDLSLDAVAIRLEFWYWHGIPLNDAFFGVPADNFLGWLLVSFTFSVLTRHLWDRPQARPALRQALWIQWLLIPPTAYALYLLLEWPVHGVYRAIGAETQKEQLIVVQGVVLLFLLAAGIGALRAPRPPHSERSPMDLLSLHLPRHAFHVFACVGLLCLSPALRLPELWILAGSIWLLEVGVALTAHHRERRVLCS
ncbi:MAG: carotenoid biosynthesis protein [Chloroherpetonaceae bacterium]|nr:carotenoid biosynthesis protein [Chthonomonadaceae bacterium]MDW8207100.1 carotenoid biosynthesis protein [Chloroherpetonaceae bacterium]